MKPKEKIWGTIGHRIAVQLIIFFLIYDRCNGQCFGGTETYEKTTGVIFVFGTSQGLLTQPGTGITRDCTAICRQTPSCAAFIVDYELSRCQSYTMDSTGHRNSLQEKVGTNFYEKICLRGVSNLNAMCGDRLWAFERVLGAYLEGFDDREERNVQSKTECEKLCLFETSFTCRSAEYDETQNICRLSREDRRSQPNAFRRQVGGTVDYLENQCVRPLPDCRYNVRQDSAVLSMDELQFAASQGECEALCDQARGFSCRAYTYAADEKRCYLSGDDSISLNNAPLMTKRGALYAEKQCSVSHCEDGLFTFEKVTGHFLRTAQQVGLSMAASPGITLDCSSRCLDSGSDCPAFSLDYAAMKCFKLDRNTQGRGSELSPREGQSYFEKICLRGNVHVCAGRAWAFERRPGKELRGHDNSKVGLVQSRRDCMEACLAERLFECRSAEYDTATAECRLSSEDRRTKPNDYIDAPPTVEYLENQCVTPETRCNFEAVPNSYPRYLDKVVAAVNDDMDCERRCFGSKDFICRSFSYYSTQSQCFLSGDDRASAGTEALMSRPGTNYYERNCRNKNINALPGGSGPIDQGTLFGRPDFEYRPGPINGRCLVGRMEYEKVTGFELTGERGYSLVRERIPGITGLCTRRCQADPRCSAFNLDYTTSECIALTTVSDASRIDLRPTPGVAYFEGICLRRGGCGLLWTFERIPNYELRGFEGARFQGISKTECEERCLDERTFNCRSASYNFRRHECRLSPEDRFSRPQALMASLDTDYLENACAAPPLRCQYRNQQRDRALLYVDKSLSAFSDSSCQHACDVEREFVCRSFTFLSQTGLNTNQCLLSGDKESLVGREGFQPQSGAMYAEKECIPPNVQGHPGASNYIPNEALGPAYPGRPGGFGPSAIPPHGVGHYPGGSGPGYRPYPGQSGYPPGPYQGHRGPGSPYDPRYVPGRSPGIGFNYPDSSGPGPSAVPPPIGTGYPGVIDAGANGIYTDPDLSPYPCRHTLTYEKVAGAMYGNTRREPLRTRVDVGITAQCLVECAQQRDRCLAVSLENVRGGRQRCYGLERSADSENAPLQPAPDLGYFQKICLRERPCAKAWAFTRVPSYELAVANALEVRNVYSRRQCQDECLRASRVICRSATYYSRDRLCKISADTRRTQPESFRRSTSDVDYMENECAPQPANCEYTDYPGRFLPYSDRYVARTFDITECRRLCDQEREFQCRSFNFHSLRRECYLSSDDTFTADKAALVNDHDFFYSERGSCSNVRVDCTQSDMLVTFMFAAPFEGRVYATGNPQACFEMGSAQNQIVLRIPMGTQCGTVQQGRGRYVNHVVIQQNPVIMQETDKTVRVECSFDASDQTVSFAPQGTRHSEGGGISVSVPFRPSGTNIVTNTAPVPKVRMRIVMRSGQEASVVGLGEELQLRIEIDPTSAFGIFARNLEARTDNGELLTLIDNVGCPRDPNIFPALQVERGSRNLFVDFKAFRFPSTSTVNFVATVQFCQDICEPIRCYNGLVSFGKRRRREIEAIDGESEPPSSTTVTISSSEGATTSSVGSTTTTNAAPTENLERIDTTTDSSTSRPYAEASMIASMANASAEVPSTTAVTNGTEIDLSDDIDGQLPPGYPNGGNWNEEEQQQLDTAVLPSPSQEPDEKKEPLPSELPLQLKLVVGEDSLPNSGTNNNSNSGGKNRHVINPNSGYGMYPLGDNVYTEEGYVCTPSSTIIASVFTTVFFHVGLVAGFIFFYRTKKKHWRKMAGLDESVTVSASSAAAGHSAMFSPEVLFRSVYDRLPPHPAFSSLGTLGRQTPTPLHNSSPANTPPEMLQ